MVEMDSLDYKIVLIAKTRNTYKYEEIMKRAEVKLKSNGHILKIDG